ncbi:MAG: hypothetical protein AAGF44_04985 [Pseudomonadota bacterium]
MMTLVFVTCLIGAPTECRKNEMPIYEEISPMVCLTGAQAELARWRETHPGWRIVQWRCGAVPVVKVEN